MASDHFFDAFGEQINVNHISWLSRVISHPWHYEEDDFQPFRHLSHEIWADEPAWTKYHAACWHALRNDNWTNMPFSPKRLGKPEKFAAPHALGPKAFMQTASAYTALADILHFGDVWGKAVSNLKDWHYGFVEPHHLNFVKFWYPMLNVYGNWLARFGRFGWPKIFNHLDSHLDFYQIDPNPHWGHRLDVSHTALDTSYADSDPLHLSDHSGKPINGWTSPIINIAWDHKNLDVPQAVLESTSYAGWAEALTQLKINHWAIIRVDVQVHETMRHKTTLGNFLVRPNGENFDNEIRFISDNSLLRFRETGSFDIGGFYL